MRDVVHGQLYKSLRVISRRLRRQLVETRTDAHRRACAFTFASRQHQSIKWQSFARYIVTIKDLPAAG
jgi:hypothetical protein